LRRKLVQNVRMAVTAAVFADIERAGLFVTAIQFGIGDRTTPGQLCQSISARRTMTAPTNLRPKRLKLPI